MERWNVYSWISDNGEISLMSGYGVNQNELEKNILISVLITAYDRREFIMDALRSVVNQNLDRSLYEIVVVKNFSEPIVDDYISEIGAKPVFSESSKMGKFIYDALPACSGNVIAFLEDDDWWSSDKLTIVHNAFSGNEKIGYYHNSVKSVDSNGDVLENVPFVTVAEPFAGISDDPEILRKDGENTIGRAL